MLERRSVFEQVGPEKTQQVVAEFLRIAGENDGNRHEVLEAIGERLRICYGCANYSDQLQAGLCPDCDDRSE